jgi:hypothetical protein
MKLFSIQNELPIRLKRFRLDPIKAQEFNYGVDKKGNPKFARQNYRYLYELIIDKGAGKTFIQLATTDFKQVLYSIKNLWNAYDGKPYDRHGHPVIMTAYDVTEAPMDSTSKSEPEDNNAARYSAKHYSSNNSATTSRR